MNTSKQVNVMIGLLFVFLVATLLYWMWDSVRAEDAEERQIVKNAEVGGELYSLNCRSCHGTNGLGIQANSSLPGFALNVEGLNRPDDPGLLMERQDIILNTINCGRIGTLMPQWAEDQGGPLNDFQIEQLVALITGGMLGLDPPDDPNAVSERGWEAAVEAANHADILEGKRLARSVGPEDTVLVLTDAKGLIVGSLLRIGDEAVLLVDAPASSNLLEDVSADQTDLPVDRAGDLFRSGDIVQVGSERMRVVSASGDTLGVERALEGTDARGHRVNAQVLEAGDEILVERAVAGTQGQEHEEGVQLYAGPLEPPTGPLTGEGQDFGPCGQRGVAAPSSAASPTDATGGTEVEIKMVPVSQFDKTELTITADTDVTITTDNTDPGIPHNFAVYTSREAAEGGEKALAATEICNGPCTDTLTLNLGAGEYFFRCDVHPIQMIGTLVVTE
jgi:plastocyanin/mono/diheme cytochrome c family protein